VSEVKGARTYDGRGRQERARLTRERAIDVARAVFLEKGYGATTIAAIAEQAGVSVETIYKAFGGKPGLIRAIHERGLEGRGAVPAESRSDSTSSSERDPNAIIDKWGALVAEVSPLAAPILLLVRTAAAADDELSSLFREIDEARLSRMKRNAAVLKRRGFLRKGVTVDTAAEIMWAYTAPELYDLLVIRRGWSPEELGAFVAAALKAALLPRV
jgi:AcrR family transcriptional regulator